VRQLSLPFKTEAGGDQIVSLIDFDLRPGVVPAMIPLAERKLL